MELYLYPHVSRAKWILVRTIFIDHLKNCGDFFVGPVFRSILIEKVEWCVFMLVSHQTQIHYTKEKLPLERVSIFKSDGGADICEAMQLIKGPSCYPLKHFFFLHAQSGLPCTTHSKTTWLEASIHMHRKKGDFSISTKHHSRHLRQQGNHDTTIWEEATTTFAFFLCISRNSFV